MNIMLQTLARILGFIAIVGLLAAPLDRPAFAAIPDHMAMSNDMAAMNGTFDTSAMNGMACCPDTQPGDHDCGKGGKDCPLMALCSFTAMSGATFSFVPALHAVSADLRGRSDEGPDSLHPSPPPEPPRA